MATGAGAELTLSQVTKRFGTFTAVDPSQRRRGSGEQQVQVGVERDLEGFRAQRQGAQQGGRDRQERAADAGVGDQENATGHAGKLTERYGRRLRLPAVRAVPAIPPPRRGPAPPGAGQSCSRW